MTLLNSIKHPFFYFLQRLRNVKFSNLTIKFQSSIFLIAAIALVVAVVAIYKEVARYSLAQVTLASATLEHTNQATEDALREALVSKAKSIGRFIADASKDYILSYNLTALQQMQKDVTLDREVAYGYFVKKTGKPFLKHGKLDHASDIEEKFEIAVDKETIGYFVLGMNLSDIEVKAEQNRVTLIKLIDDIGETSRNAQWSIIELIVTVTILLLAATLLMVYYFFRSMILKPVTDLRDVAMEVQHGNLQVHVEKYADDEIGSLASTFNGMIEALHATTFSREYMESIIRSMGDMLVVIDGKRNIVMANPALLVHTGYQENELVGMRVDILFPDTKNMDRLLQLLAEQGEIIKYDTCFRSKSNSCLNVEISGNYLLSASEIFGIVFAATDISDRLIAKQQLESKNLELERSNRQLDQFAYVVSHDLKAPLRAIANLSAWIEEDLGTDVPEGVHEQMELMRGRVNRMEALINGILAYSRAGRMDVEEKSVDVAVLLRETIETLPVPSGYSITVGPGMPRLVTAPVLLAQVFSNLLSNAIKYRSADTGQTTVTVDDTGSSYKFTVADDGPGIAPEYHEKIFAIFQTLTPRDQFESTGVGLSIVKKIVEDHGGVVQVDSDIGRGAKFSFTWPQRATRVRAA